MIDRFRQMAIFAKTIDHGSFRGAARELHLSPSVVSHHIAQLEEHLGVALIYRTTRKLTLTNEGERLLEATRNMLDAVEGELADITGQASEPSGELRLTASSVLSQSHIIELIAAFAKTHPRIQLSVDFSDQRRDMIEDGFDVAIRMAPKRQKSASSRLLFKSQRRLVAASDYVAQQGKVSNPKDVADWDWLVLGQVQNIPMTFANGAGEKETIKPTAHLFSNDAQALYRLARNGAGVVAVPEFLAERDVADGQMEFVLPEWSLQSLDVFAVWPPNAPKHGLARLLVEGMSGG